MKLISWNVNGIKSVLKKGFLDFCGRTAADVYCLQETRSPKMSVEVPLRGYKQLWNNAIRPGFSGTAVFTKIRPEQVSYGIGIPKHDTEGRVITMEFPRWFLVNVYVPNSKRGLERLPYRTREWDTDFVRYLKKLEKKKPVIFCGDLNVAHREIDLANPKSNIRNHGFTPEERAGFDNILKAGFLDAYREFVGEGGRYTWWSRLNNCRQRNIGWRIDYFCISAALRPRLQGAFILQDVMGSDHCPVGIDIQ